METQGRRAELVEAAYAQLAEHGFEGLRTRDVASAVGVNVATLHYYYPTKEALIRAVVGHAMARFRSTLPTTGSATDQLRGHLNGLRRLSRTEPELFAVMGELALRAGRDRGLAAIIRKTDDFWHATLSDLLRQAQAEGVAPGTDPDDAAGLIVAALKGTFMLPSESRNPERLDQALDQLERWLGLSARRRARAR
jgi:AcrR family transcriptional regulator